ncbi:MAG: hypothetical protein M3P43_00260 [Actinomycetota bacterium]|nr:hypothetical protein [Actinomycetota bacterium]
MLQLAPPSVILKTPHFLVPAHSVLGWVGLIAKEYTVDAGMPVSSPDQWALHPSS